MRADRLVAVLLLLQRRARVTAAEVAAELEISERTARRDLDALAVAGIPVFSQAGRGGGWSLIGGARTDLSGLTAAEARTLFLVAGPSASATPEIKAALRKLVRALPEPFRAEAEAAASAVVLDHTTWDRTPAPPPVHLEVLQQAVVDGVQVRLGYAGREGPESERTVHPLGLVAKASVWYLVAGTEAGLRTFRLSRVRSVQVTDLPVERPEGFDLAETWQSIIDSVDQRRAGFVADARVEADAVRWLRAAFGTRLSVGEPGLDGRISVELRSWSAHSVASELAGFGGMVEVVGPPEVRAELAALASDLGRLYGPATSAGSASARGDDRIPSPTGEGAGCPHSTPSR